jgi:probable HAF family extracellular repeat protein
VNNFGQIVGDSTLADNLYENPFSYEGGVMTDLNLATSAANNDLRSLFLAFSINDDGQIVGEALNNLGEDVAFFLTPTSVAPTQTLRDNGPPAQTVSDMSNSGLLLSLGFAGLSILSQSTRVRRKRGESGDIAD